MAELKPMPELDLPPRELAQRGQVWSGTAGSQRSDGQQPAKHPRRFDKAPRQAGGQGMEFGHVFDAAFGDALAEMLGGVPVVRPNANALTASAADCVEVGTARVIGGIRPQNYDAAYRPDGPRVVFDSRRPEH